MGSVVYYRFHNTIQDMEDCISHLDDDKMSEAEDRERARFIELCRQVAEDYPEDEWYDDDPLADGQNRETD